MKHFSSELNRQLAHTDSFAKWLYSQVHYCLILLKDNKSVTSHIDFNLTFC